MFRRPRSPANRLRRRNRRHELLESRRLMAANLVYSEIIQRDESPALVSTQTPSQSAAPRVVLPIVAQFSVESIREDDAGTVHLTLRRNPRDISGAMSIQVTGGDASQLPMPSTIVIPAGKSEVTLRLTPTNDTQAEKSLTLVYTFSATGRSTTSATLQLHDDESPKFQNPVLRHDVNNDGRVSAVDALMVLNALGRSSTTELDPSQAEPGGIFHDVNGDYAITALDALDVINSLGQSRSTTASDSIQHPRAFQIPEAATARITARESAIDSDRNDETMRLESKETVRKL